MKKIISILVILLILVSCGGGYNPPSNPNSNHGEKPNTDVTNKQPHAEFSYSLQHPLKVVFKNLSSDYDGANSIHWDFGDGKISTDKNPTHKYSKKGVYKVTLRVSSFLSNRSDTYTTNVTVVEPTKCYITGVVYNEVPVYNEYYNLRCTDDYILFETLYWYTNWSLLSSANLPFTYDFTNKQQIDFSKSEYVVRLYRNSKPSGKGTQVEYWSIFPSGLKSNFDEKIKKTSGKSSITLNLGWYD